MMRFVTARIAWPTYTIRMAERRRDLAPAEVLKNERLETRADQDRLIAEVDEGDGTPFVVLSEYGLLGAGQPLQFTVGVPVYGIVFGVDRALERVSTGTNARYSLVYDEP